MTARTAPVPWGAEHVAFSAGVFLVTLAGAHLLIGTDGPRPILAHLIACVAGTATILALAARSGAAGLRALGIRTEGNGRDLARGAGLYLAFLAGWLPLVTRVYVPLLRAAGVHFEQQDALRLVRESWEHSSPSVLAAVLLTVAVAGPLAEELFFRGLLQPLLTARAGVFAGILLTSVTFGLLHDPFPWMAVPIGLLGGFFGWLRVRTGNVLVTFALHALFNTTTLVLFLCWPRLYDLCYNSGR